MLNTPAKVVLEYTFFLKQIFFWLTIILCGLRLCIVSAGKRQNSMVIGYAPCLCSVKTGTTTSQFDKQCHSLRGPTLVQ